MIRTVDELIDTLGGNSVVAELTGFGSSAISNWRSRGRIPADLFLTLTTKLGNGITVDPALFGMSRRKVRA